MIDLHIHSIYSDGTSKLTQILEQANQLKLEAISITDHENCDIYEEIDKINIKNFFSGKIIRGIELKAQYKEHVIDVLGYNINTSKMKTYLKELYGKATREIIQEKQLKNFYKYKEKYDLILTPIEELKWNKNKDWASVVFYNEIKKHEENKQKVPKDLWEKDFINFRSNYYHNKNDMFYIDMASHFPKLDIIIKKIHQSRGDCIYSPYL